jgi:ribonuclease T1
MTRWRRTLASLAVGLGVLGSLLLWPGSGAQARAQAPAVQAAPQDPIPPHVRETLAYVRKHGFPPPGYVGGRVYGNYEGLLPRYDTRRKRIEYREWDVRARAEGRNRGMERLVTARDGRAWYTADHYRTFVEVK